MFISLWEAHGRPRAESEEAKRAAVKIRTYLDLAGASISPASRVILSWNVTDEAIALASDIPMYRYHADPLDKLVVDLMDIMIQLPLPQRVAALALGHGLYADDAP